MLTTRELITTLYNALNQKLKKSRSNWEQNNPTAEDYIKNRPFYTDDSGKIHTIGSKYLPENIQSDWNQNDKTSIDFIKNKPFGSEYSIKHILSERHGDYYADMGIFYISGSEAILLRENETYTVTYNGTSYECVASIFNNNVYLGNGAIINSSLKADSSKPFIFVTAPEDLVVNAGIVAMAKTSDGATTLTISISCMGETIRHLDSKYIKDMYYEEPEEVILVNNLTNESYFDENYPPCTFVIGDNYKVIWNNTEYNCTCELEGSYRYLECDDNLPFYIDDDGGDGLYVNGDTPWTLTITHVENKIHKIDNKYIPLATPSEPGGVHPYISTESGGDVWMNPTTGQLYCGLPVATPTTLGGVKPIAKTSVMTQEVGVDSSGKLYAMPSAQADWNEIDEESASYIKNKPRISQDYIILTDSVNGFSYTVKMMNGNLISYAPATSIEITKYPAEALFSDGDTIDISDMVVSVVCSDGSTREVDYTYEPTTMTSDTKFVTISYEEDGVVYTTKLSVSLIDFDYTDNGDGTYTITGWKQTLYGEPSTEMIVPSSNKIII